VLIKYIKPRENSGKKVLEHPKKTKRSNNEISDTIPILINGINTEAGLSRLLGNQVLYEELLKKFTHNNEEAVEKIKNFLIEGDFKNCTLIVHTIKGTGANLGIQALAESAEILEKKYRNEIESEKDLTDFDKNLTLIIDSVRDYFKTKQPKEIFVEDNENASDILIVLNELKQEMEAFNTDVASIAERVKNQLKGTLKKDFSEIMNLIDNLQYDEAIQSIDRFIVENKLGTEDNHV
jgi:HPt (histidine-containing phosphotransfer) domain-containing protein